MKENISMIIVGAFSIAAIVTKALGLTEVADTLLLVSPEVNIVLIALLTIVYPTMDKAKLK